MLSHLLCLSPTGEEEDRGDEMRSDCMGSHQQCYKVRTQSSAKMTHIHCDGAESSQHTGREEREWQSKLDGVTMGEIKIETFKLDAGRR